MIDEQSTFTCFALYIKGGFYSSNGQITENISEAKLFNSVDSAKKFREEWDPRHLVDQSILLTVQMLVSWEGSDEYID